MPGTAPSNIFDASVLNGSTITPATLNGTTIIPGTCDGTNITSDGTYGIGDAQLNQTNLYPHYLRATFDGTPTDDSYATYNGQVDQYLHQAIEAVYLQQLYVLFSPGDTPPTQGSMVTVTINGTNSALNTTCDGTSNIAQTTLAVLQGISIDDNISFKFFEANATADNGTNHRVTLLIKAGKGPNLAF